KPGFEPRQADPESAVLPLHQYAAQQHGQGYVTPLQAPAPGTQRQAGGVKGATGWPGVPREGTSAGAKKPTGTGLLTHSARRHMTSPGPSQNVSCARTEQRN